MAEGFSFLNPVSVTFQTIHELCFHFLGTSFTIKRYKKEIPMLKVETKSKMKFKTSTLANNKPQLCTWLQSCLIIVEELNLFIAELSYLTALLPLNSSSPKWQRNFGERKLVRPEMLFKNGGFKLKVESSIKMVVFLAIDSTLGCYIKCTF